MMNNMMEAETEKCSSCSYPTNAGHSPECSFHSEINRENSNKNTIEEITSIIQIQVEQVKINEADRNENGELLAYPEGPVSNLPEQEWKMVRTKAFQEWFQGSVVVDENGEPLILYHGTNENFSRFDTENDSSKKRDAGYFGKGSYFTPSQDLALLYGPTIYKTFLNIKKIQSFSIEDGNVRFREKPLPKEIHEEVFKRYEPKRKKKLEELKKEEESNQGNWAFISTWNGEEDFEDILSDTVREVLVEKEISGAVGHNPTSKLYEYVAFQSDDIMIIPEK